VVENQDAASEPRGYTSDEMAITALVCRYPDLIDSGDLDGIAELFAHATLGEGDEAISGGAPLAQMLKGLVRTYDGKTYTKHLVTNLVVEMEADGVHAAARSSITVLQAHPPAFPLQIIATNRHYDSFQKVDGAWRFARRSNITDLVGDMSHHVNQGDG
jgi:SnoaL-like domain